MEDFSALAARVAASVVELRGCLILSRDGVVLGAHPAGEEGLVRPTWLRFSAVGEPEKGFIEFGSEIWTYVRRGPYVAFAVSELGVRPGLVIDQLEQMLISAQEMRARREALPAERPGTPPGPSLAELSSAPRPTAAGPPAPQPVAPPQSAAPPERQDDDEAEVDRVALAREFSRLLQESGGRDENN